MLLTYKQAMMKWTTVGEFGETTIKLLMPHDSFYYDKKTIEKWINVYKDGVGRKLWDSKEEGDKNDFLRNRIACVKLTGEYEVE